MRYATDITTQLLVRNNRTTTDTFITDTTLQNWLNDAHLWAAAYKKWPFTEDFDVVGTYNGSTEFFDYGTLFALGSGAKIDSVRELGVGNLTQGTDALTLFRKVNFKDYLRYRTDYPDGTDPIYSDMNRTLYINPNVDTSGDINILFQFRPALFDLTAAASVSSLTVFSEFDDEGNEAIVEKMTSYLKQREHYTQEAELHDQRAATKLDEIWKRVLDEQTQYQAAPKSNGMWERINVINGGRTDDITNTDQFI